MSKIATCPYCGNDHWFFEYVEGLTLVEKYIRREDGTYFHADTTHLEHNDAYLLCGECDKELPAEEYEKFLEAV